jgi:hypothetical protein
MWARTGVIAQLAGVIVLASVAYLQTTTGDGGDLVGFHRAWHGGLYEIPWHQSGAFVYSPAAGALLWPFGHIPFQLFAILWVYAQLAALAWLVGVPMAAVLAVFLVPVVRDLESGNIHLFLAVAVAMGVRHPAAWSAVLLTKVTPGVAIGYHLGARQWRALAVAVGVTAGIVGIGVLIAPGLWLDWLELLRSAAGQPPHQNDQLPVPLVIRLPVALGVAVVAGWRGWAWAVPIAAVLGMPSVWLSSFCILLASWRLLDPGGVAALLGRAGRDRGQPAADSTLAVRAPTFDGEAASVGAARSAGITSDQE